ncbi:hypothetical protein CHS0354_030278 [Potamilus streckersoni]|uniref:SH3 domain-containing protein n=1 Tax=Potamilus streckersoni TaxID=2493646 RepID=A0AAE0RUZ9_9BIVA|nr:hypothetical protein CHS0354_030278 [Potamilus streckersoni]
MYRALYSYNTDMQGYLTFKAGDQFTVLDMKFNDWMLVQNGYGEIGYVPKNYVTQDEASHSEVLKSIDRAIEAIHFQAASNEGTYTQKQRENLNKLIQHRKNVTETMREDNHHKLPATSPVSPQSPTAKSGKHQTTGTHEDCLTQQSTQEKRPEGTRESKRASKKRAAPAPPSETIYSQEQIASNDMKVEDCVTQTHLPKVTIDAASSPIKLPSELLAFSPQKPMNSSCHVDISALLVPPHLGADLVEEVRKNTQLSYEKSITAVETVIGLIGFRIPEISPVLDKIYSTFHEKKESSEEDTSHDLVRLNELFRELKSCKDDSQQRSWALHEDEILILRHLQELLSILENAKKSTSRKALSSSNYECVYDLVQYYQMETRVKLRLLLLQVFGAMCGLDVMVISVLLYSVLTTELAKEIQASVRDVQRVSYTGLVLTMIFSTGEAVPANLHDHLNEDFVGFLFDVMENPPSPEFEDQVTDILVNLILAFNLHFQEVKDNTVMQVLASKGTMKVFTEKLLLLINRGVDPVWMFHFEPKPPNSLLKFLEDMYSQPATACLLYTNDMRVLLDIIIRNLTDLTSGDKVRTSYLYLTQLIVTNSDYREDRHRLDDLRKTLNKILQEEEGSHIDKDTVHLIFQSCDILS